MPTISVRCFNRAARVMAAGHGGQILLAESTAVLLSGVDLIDLGGRAVCGIWRSRWECFRSGHRAASRMASMTPGEVSSASLAQSHPRGYPRQNVLS